MQANQDLADAVFLALKDHLGTYSGGDTGPAFWTVNKSFAMTAEGLAEGTRVEGLEAVMALYPDSSFNAMYEMGDGGGMKGVLYHSLVLKQYAPQESVIPALEALMVAFPLMSLRTHRQPRQIVTDLSEALMVYVPTQTD